MFNSPNDLPNAMNPSPAHNRCCTDLYLLSRAAQLLFAAFHLLFASLSSNPHDVQCPQLLLPLESWLSFGA